MSDELKEKRFTYEIEVDNDKIWFGKERSGPGGVGSSGSSYQGIINHFVLSNQAWDEAEIGEFFSVTAEQLSPWTFTAKWCLCMCLESIHL